MRNAVFVAILLVLAVAPHAGADVFYVDIDNASGTEDGASWATAFTTIQAAIDAAFADGGGEVWVAEGTYAEARTSDPHGTSTNTGSLMMKNGVDLYGGFAGGETARSQRHWEAHATIIDGSTSRDGSPAYHVVVGAVSTLDGFTITGGQANGYGQAIYGGGLYNNGTPCVIRNCTFLSNSASNSGGGLHNNAASSLVEGCEFRLNNSVGDGGGIYNISSDLVVSCCLFAENSAGEGGGMKNLFSSSPSITNCIFYNNTSQGVGGGMENNNTTPTVMNCVFYGNRSITNEGGGLYAEYQTTSITNCIFWANSPNQIRGLISVGYSDVEGGHEGTGNIGATPMFVDVNEGDFRLEPGSPCIDVGTLSGAPATDYTGYPRPIGTGVDMGAYEASSAVFVDQRNTSGAEDGRNWQTAFTTLQEAIDEALPYGGDIEVWVADGVYTSDESQVAVLCENTLIYGGFGGLAAPVPERLREERDPSTYTSIVDGENTRRCVVGAEGALLDGLTLRNGAADDGAGLLLDGVSMTVRDCTFEDNAATNDGGAVAAINGASATVEASRFDSNVAGGSGGGLAIDGASQATLTNCLLYENQAVTGAGMSNATGGTVSVMHGVCYNNAASGAQGGAILNDGTATLTNSILWANTPDQVAGIATVTYCDVQGGEAGVGNLNEDPCFWDAANGDFRLQTTSGCIDAGTSTGAPSTDIDGNARPIDFEADGSTLVYDLGAYEMPNVVYVDIDTPAASYLQDGRSWNTAFATIQEGVDQAGTDGGGEVWVAEGTYTATTDPVVTMADNVSLYGGFTGANDNEETHRSQRDWDTYTTTIDGEDTRSGVIARENTRIDGFTITRCNSYGLQVEDCKAVVSESVFSANTWGIDTSGSSTDIDVSACSFLQNGIETELGAAMRNIGSGTVRVRGCRFEENVARNGAALYNSSTSPIVTDCYFYRNTAHHGGGAIQQSSLSDGLYQDCVFLESSALEVGHGGAVAVNDRCAPRFERCTFGDGLCQGDSDPRGAALQVSDNTSVVLENCVFFNNVAEQGTPSGACVYAYQNSHVSMQNCTAYVPEVASYSYDFYADLSAFEIRNCIVAGRDTNLLYDNSTSTSVVYSLFQGGYTGEGNIDADPMFMDPANDNFRLKFGSPCLDTGTMDGAPLTDYNGDPRPVDIVGVGTEGAGAIDMGAFEKQRYIWYVDKDASGAGNGSSWADAYTTIQPAIDAAYPDGGGEVWVAEGVYDEARTSIVHPAPDDVNTGSLMMRDNVDLYGGFDGTETLRTERDWGAHETVIDGTTSREGSPAYHVIVGAIADLDGFTIRGGEANGPTYQLTLGGGVYSYSNSGTSVQVTNCVLKDNSASQGNGLGGGLYCDSLNGIATNAVGNCIFINNHADFGAGIWGRKLLLENCLFLGNSSDKEGAAVFTPSGGTLSATGSVFVANAANTMGGAILGHDEFTLSDCVFTRNHSGSDGGGIYLLGADTNTIDSCVFVGNVSSDKGGALASNSGVVLRVQNSAFVGNSSASHGAAIITLNNWIDIDFSTFVSNNGVGETIYSTEPYPGPVSVHNSIFRANTLPETKGATATFDYTNSETDIGGIGWINNDPAFVPGPTGTLEAPLSYDTTTYQSTVSDSSASFYPRVLEGLVLIVDGTDYYYIVDNTATTVTVWGDVTQGGTVSAPVAYEVFNWHLSTNSPCIDTGDPSSTVTEDLDGEARPNGTRVDMGCDEFYNTAPVITTNGGDDFRTQEANLTLNGTCEANSIEVHVNGSTSGVTYTPGATVWSYEGTLIEGANVLTVTSITSALLESLPATITVIYDPTEPQVSGAVARGSLTVRVTFDEDMTDNAALATAGNYTFSGAGAALTATAAARVDAMTVDVSVNEMTLGAAYTVAVSTSGPEDLAGNTVDPAHNNAGFSGVGVRPKLLSAAAQNSTTVRFTFDEDMTDNADLRDPASYTFTGSGVPITATSATPYGTAAVDVVVNEMTEGSGNYTAAVATDAPVDLAGNTVDPAAYTSVFNGDGLAPQVFSAAALNSTTVRVTYNEAMKTDGYLTDAAAYAFYSSTGTPLTSTFAALVNAACVDITVNEMTQGASYTVMVFPIYIRDVAENALDYTHNFASFSGAGVAPGPPTITTDGGEGEGQDFGTSSESVSLEGTCDAETETIHVNGSTTGVTFSGSTTWSYEGTLSYGENLFSVTAFDAALNESLPAEIKVTRLQPSSITLLLQGGVDTVALGESLTLKGQVSPTPSGSPNVTFESTSPSGAVSGLFPEGTVLSSGQYTKTFYPTEASEGRGDWLVESSWPGDDTYMPAESDPVSFTVLKAQPTVLVELNTSSAPMGYGDLEATVTVSAPLPGPLSSLLSGRTVELHVRKPDQSIAGTVVGTTDASGAVVFTDSEFSAQGISFTEPGTWQFQANVDEDNNFYRATSVGYDEPETPRLTIKDRAGYAVLLLGKLDENGEGLAEHAKTLDYVYRVLRDRGFAHEDIYYLREGPAQPHPDIYVDDTTPSQADVANALEQWAVAKMNAAPAPLVVVFLDHGDVDAFYAYSGLYDESRTITPAEMDGYLDALQANLSPQAAEEPVVFICGSCHGGSFMPAVSDSTRLVITSCSEDEVSHRGVFDPTDGTDVRDGEPFVTELFRRLGAGDTLKASFEAASQKILEYTASTSNGGASTYPQHALLDDNGDGLGTSGTLSDAPGEDGGWARLLTLGYGVNAGASVGWLTATGTLTLGAGEAMPTLEARADENDPGGLHEAWVEVKTPLYAGADPADPTMPDYQQVVEMPQFSFEAGISDPANGYFRWATFGTTFDAPGTYQVFYYLRDGETGDASTHLLTTVYRESATNQPPDPVTLTYPADGATTFTSVIFAWEETTDPDGDAVTYRLEVSPDAGFATDVIVREGLLSTVVQLDETDGILDGATYYWRIVPVDPYGATPATNPVRTFSTDNNNPSVPSAFTGLVTCATTYAAVANATVTVGSTGLTGLTGTTGRFFIGNIATGTYTVAVSAAGYQTAYVVVTFLGGTAVSQSIRLTPEQNQLTVDPLTATLSPGGGTCQLTVGGSSLMNWQAQITSGAAWLGITSGASGTGPGAVNLSYAANTGSAPRSAVVRITAPGATGSPKDVILNQPVDLTPELSVSPAGRLLSASDTYTDFAVENLGYGTLYWSTQVILGNWITIDVGMAGENNGMIRLTLAKNTTPDDRIGTLWVSAPGANNGSQFLTITQTGDTTPPVLTIQGPDPKTIEQHAAYYDAGATALDDVDGDLTPCIACASTVDTSTPGTYHVDYSVRDTAQNTAADQRTVHVVATTPVEETVGSGGGSVSRDGILVVILPGALAGDTTVTIDRADPGAPVLPDDILALISGTTFAVGPEGQTAQGGGDLATVTIWYPDADQDGYIDGTSYHEDNVAIFRTDQSGGNPVALYGTVDPDANTITVTTECFSLFTVAAADPGLPLSPWVIIPIASLLFLLCAAQRRRI